jgi:hypothetical protein
MQEFQMEILILDKFMINNRMCDRGIIQFLANGQHGAFTLNITTDNVVVFNLNDSQESSNQSLILDKNNNNVNDSGSIGGDSIDNEPQQQTQASSNKLYSNPNFARSSVSLATAKKDKKPTLFSFKPLKAKISAKRRGGHSESDDRDRDSINFEHAQLREYKASTKLIDVETEREVKAEALKLSETQFSKLKFSEDSKELKDIQMEIESDMNEFKACMKNSVFYGSGIQRYYNSELDRIRSRFIELEDSERHWATHVMNYIKKTDSKVTIPAPKMSDEVAIRRRMVKNLKEMHTLVTDFVF